MFDDEIAKIKHALKDINAAYAGAPMPDVPVLSSPQVGGKFSRDICALTAEMHQFASRIRTAGIGGDYSVEFAAINQAITANTEQIASLQADLNTERTTRLSDFNTKTMYAKSYSYSGGSDKHSFWNPTTLGSIVVFESDMELDGWLYGLSATILMNNFTEPKIRVIQELNKTHSYTLGTDYKFQWDHAGKTWGLFKNGANVTLRVKFRTFDKATMDLINDYPGITNPVDIVVDQRLIQ